jgi:predicted MPP superfamily phosphohydrolase
VQTIGGSQLHISAGTGQLLPLRFCCPPEMVWLRCVPRAVSPRPVLPSSRGV